MLIRGGINLPWTNNIRCDNHLLSFNNTVLQCILTDGPFFICCNRESVFLSVSDSRQIEATQDIHHASKFYIVRCDEGDDHFFVVHEAPTSLQDEKVTQFEKMPPVPMYLKASMNWRRRSTPTKPLMMEMNVNSRLSIHSRRDKEFHPAKLTEWVSQKEVFFIRCEEQAWLYRKTSYLCVYQPKGESTYVTGCKPNIRSDDSNRFMLFRLVKLKEDEVATCTATTSIAPFIIKFRGAHDTGKDLFFEVSRDCKEVSATEEKAKASTFHLKVEKLNYFRILYKTNDNQVYYLHAPTKLVASRRQILGLSLREDPSARSYMAFYYASDTHSHSRRLHQRELSDLIESLTEDKLHITCQCSVDSDSRDASDLYVKQKKRDSFRVQVKHGKTKRLEKDQKSKKDKEQKAKAEKEQNAEAHKEQKAEAEQNAEAEKEQNAAQTQPPEAKSTHFTEFVLLRKDQIAPFIIKFRVHGVADKDFFFEVSSDCKEVYITEDKVKASKFHLKVEKSNYFKILYKNASNQVYYLYAPTKPVKLAASSQLSLLPREDDINSARSYMAFYYADDTPSRSRRLQQRELSDLIESSTEDKLHITCQHSVDCASNSRDVSDFFVEQIESTFHVKVKHGKMKQLATENEQSTHFTGFVLQSLNHKQALTTNSTQTQHSSNGANSQTPSREDPRQISESPLAAETQLSSNGTDSQTPSNGADSLVKEYQPPTDMSREPLNSPEGGDSKKVRHSSTSADSKTPSAAETQHSSNGTNVDAAKIPSPVGVPPSSSTDKSADSKHALPSTKQMPPHSADSGSKTPSAVESNQPSTDVPSSNPHSMEDSKQEKHSLGTDSETKASRSESAQAQPSPIGTAHPSVTENRPRQKSPATASRRVGFWRDCSIM
jgi:hypothetical protein